MCCTLLYIQELDKRALDDCQHCIAKTGCSIWEDKPEECTLYDCAWRQSDGAPLKLRPDNCHMIFERVSGRIFLGTQDPNKLMSTDALQQIGNFDKQGFSVIVNNFSGKFNLFLNESHDELEIMEEFKAHVRMRLGGNIRD